MTRPIEQFNTAMHLVDLGLNDCQISRLMSIPRGTIRDWRRGSRLFKQVDGSSDPDCPMCSRRPVLHGHDYAYLLGLYLGDGCLSEHPRTVALRIVCDAKYPNIIRACERAMKSMRPSNEARVFRAKKIGCFEVMSLWQHWPCLFPQHGRGRKHLRRIELREWQLAIVERHPLDFLRGLIHSDGCRDLNYVNGKAYPRYQFSNRSADIRFLFAATCTHVGIHWTHPMKWVISISRRSDVDFLDQVIGPKS